MTKAVPAILTAQDPRDRAAPLLLSARHTGSTLPDSGPRCQEKWNFRERMSCGGPGFSDPGWGRVASAASWRPGLQGGRCQCR